MNPTICVNFFTYVHELLAPRTVTILKYCQVNVNILEDFDNASPYFCTFLANRIWD